MPTIQPLGKRILLQRKRTEAKVGSIHIPDSYRKYTQMGYIAAVGDQVTKLKIGDYVLASIYSGIEIEAGCISPEPYWLVNEDDIVGVIK